MCGALTALDLRDRVQPAIVAHESRGTARDDAQTFPGPATTDGTASPVADRVAGVHTQ